MVFAVVALAKRASVAGGWKKVSSPQGRFSVEIPEGWERKETNQQDTEISVLFGPVGRDFPKVSIWGWLEAGSAWNNMTGRGGCPTLGLRATKSG